MNKGELIFVNGYEATGETYLWQAILIKVKSDEKIALAVPISELQPYFNQVVEQSTLDCIDIAYQSTCNIKQESKIATLLQKNIIYYLGRGCYDK